MRAQYFAFLYLIISLFLCLIDFAYALVNVFALVVLLPPLIYAGRSSQTLDVFLKVVNYSVLLTLPFTTFYEINYLADHSPYLWLNPTPSNLIYILTILCFSELLIVFFEKLFRSWSKKSISYTDSSSPFRRGMPILWSPNHIDLPLNPSTCVYIALLLISLALPIQVWMHNNGIGFTGIAQPSLPFKLTGILNYLIKLIIPLILSYIFLLSRANTILAFFLVPYAIVSSTLTASKGSGIIICVAVLLASYLYRKSLLILLSTAALFFNILFANVMRNLYYVDLYGVSSLDLEELTSIPFSIFEYVTNIPDPTPYFISTALVIFGRIIDFGQLIICLNYNLFEVIGSDPFSLALRPIILPLTSVDVDTHHIQYVGNVLPTGFYQGPSLIGYLLILRNHYLFIPLIVLCMVISSYILFMDSCVNRLITKYGMLAPISVPIKIFLVIMFITSAGSREMLGLTLLLFVLSCFKKISISAYSHI